MWRKGRKRPAAAAAAFSSRREGYCRCAGICAAAVIILLPYVMLVLVLDERFLGGTLRNITSSWYNVHDRDAAAVSSALAKRSPEACDVDRSALRFPFQPFVLLTTQKTGSTWLIRKLDTHPNIATHMVEVVRTHAKEGRYGPKRSTEDLATVSWEAYRHSLETAFWTAAGCKVPKEGLKSCEAPVAKGIQAAGFKIMYDQIPTHLLAEVRGWLSCRGVVVLHSVRNAFESYLSYQSQVIDAVAKGTNLDASPGERIRSNDSTVAETLPSNKGSMHVSPTHARHFVDQIEEQVRLFRQLLSFTGSGVAYLEIRYEELTSAAAERHFRAVQAFLGVPPQPMADTLQKLHFGSCAERVGDWPAVAAALRGTEALLMCGGEAGASAGSPG